MPKIKILYNGRIPGLGTGPIIKPISVTDDKLNQLITVLGRDKITVINEEFVNISIPSVEVVNLPYVEDIMDKEPIVLPKAVNDSVEVVNLPYVEDTNETTEINNDVLTIDGIIIDESIESDEEIEEVEETEDGTFVPKRKRRR